MHLRWYMAQSTSRNTISLINSRYFLVFGIHFNIARGQHLILLLHFDLWTAIRSFSFLAHRNILRLLISRRIIVLVVVVVVGGVGLILLLLGLMWMLIRRVTCIAAILGGILKATDAHNCRLGHLVASISILSIYLISILMLIRITLISRCCLIILLQIWLRVDSSIAFHKQALRFLTTLFNNRLDTTILVAHMLLMIHWMLFHRDRYAAFWVGPR